VIFNRLYKTILQENSKSQEELKQDFDRIKSIVLSQKYPKNKEEAEEMGWKIIESTESSKYFAASLDLENSYLYIRSRSDSVYMAYHSDIQKYTFFTSNILPSEGGYNDTASESISSDSNTHHVIWLWKNTYEEKWEVNFKTFKENPIPMSKQEREIGGKQKTIQSQLSNNRQQYHRYDNRGSEKYYWTRRIIQDEM